MRYIPRIVSIVVFTNNRRPRLYIGAPPPPPPPPRAILPSVDMSFVKLVAKYCTSGLTDPRRTCVLAPFTATGIIDDRTTTFVSAMHAQ